MSAPPMLGIIAGGGNLPAQLIKSCIDNGREFFVLSFEESYSPETMKNVPHAVIRIGAVGEALKHLRDAGVREIVMAGGLKRPSLSSLKPDAAGAALLKKLGKAFFFGDDALLKAITAFFEEENFKVVGAESILGGIIAPEGVLGKISPTRQEKADIIIGMKAAKNLGALDIGQAVMVENGVILGTETADGTDALIAHCGSLRQGSKKGGILVKAKKPCQETRVDLPAIGVTTIEKLNEYGFAGVAVEAGYSLLIEKAGLIEKANEYGLFVAGVRYE
jgi:DUF1009 family protein